MARQAPARRRLRGLVLAAVLFLAACGDDGGGGGFEEDEFGEPGCPTTAAELAGEPQVGDPELAGLVERFEQARFAGDAATAMALLTDGVVFDLGDEVIDDPARIREELSYSVQEVEEDVSIEVVVLEAADGRAEWLVEETPFCFITRWAAVINNSRIARLTEVAPRSHSGPSDIALDCEDGLLPPMNHIPYFDVARGDAGTPEDVVRDFFSGSLEGSDQLAEVTVSSGSAPRVRIVRRGRTVAVVNLLRTVDLGHRVEGWEACRGIEPAPAALAAVGDISEIGIPEFEGGEPSPIWYDGSGAALAADVASASRGPEHCDWESATFLSLGWPLGSAGHGLDSRRYVRDPKGVVPSEGSWAADVELPADAEDTGYHTSEFRLFVSPTEVEAAIYVQTRDGLERWHRTTSLCI